MAEEAEWQTIEGTLKTLNGRGEHASELQQMGDRYRPAFLSNKGKLLLTGTSTECRLTAQVELCNMRLAYMLKW